MLSKVLIANRGEIACRIMRTCAELGIATVAIHSDSDKNALHVRLAGEAVALPGDRPAVTYLNQAAILEACERMHVDAVHPGYGFLAENAAFASRVEDSGRIFIGPPANAILQLGDKMQARALAVAAGVPVVPGSSGPVEGPDDVLRFGTQHGWPVVIKAVHGGGGRGMRVVRAPGEAGAMLDSARAEALSAFGNEDMFLERFLDRARHVEVQIFADCAGHTVWLGDRDCSVQRLHQKIIEEAPATGLDDHVRRRMGEASVRLAKQVAYVGAGTVEYLVQDAEFFFLEVNTRIQVEHPVTEMVLGLDLVREQLLIAGGATLSWQSGAMPRGHAIECRVNAEDPREGFVPRPGRLESLDLTWSPGVRFDTGYESGDAVPAFYDSLIGKIIAWAPTRELALTRLQHVLRSAVIRGVPTTVPLVRQILAHPDMRAGPVDTRWLETRLGRLLTEMPTSTLDDSRSASADSGPGVSEVWIGDRRYLVPPAPTRRTGQIPHRRVTPTADRNRVGDSAKAGGEVHSPLHGIVLAVLVKPGQLVALGDRLLTVEAMKMENAVSATCDGTVVSVLVRTGDSVSAGQCLATILPATSKGPPLS